MCVPPSSKASAVLAGLTRVDPASADYMGWAGACPGCDRDMRSLAVMCALESVPYVTLLDGEATFPGILASCERAAGSLVPGDVLILYVSGHGGQKRDTNGDEADGMDETLCLYDGLLTDDKVWGLLQPLRARGIRVWLISDTCNSGSSYRGAHDYLAGLLPHLGREDDPNELSLLHWGGCNDGQSSFGTDSGGIFTNAMVNTYVPGKTYADWFAAVKRIMPGGQTPVREFTGPDFQSRIAFT